MLTAEGRNHIRRYLAGYVPAIAQSIAMGVGTRAESISDTALHLEATNSEINLTTYDFATNKLIFKAPVPDEFIGTIYEIGLYSLATNPNSTESGSRNITTFDSAEEDWVNKADSTDSLFSTSSVRIGTDSLHHNNGASTTLISVLRELEVDLGEHSAADTFSFAFNVANANTTGLKFRFITDSSNYYTFDLGAQSAGYKIIEVAKGTAAVTGTPLWSEITQIEVETTSGAGGASNVTFDAIRIEDKDTFDLDYILVARKVLATPKTKVEGMAQDIEFSLDVTLP